MIEVLTYNILTKKEEWISVFGFIDVNKPVKNNKSIGKKEYYKKVWEATLKNNISIVMNGKERGFHKYHIDHIYPISKGYKNGISADEIGGAENLRPLYWKINLLKSARLNTGI